MPAWQMAAMMGLRVRGPAPMLECHSGTTQPRYLPRGSVGSLRDPAPQSSSESFSQLYAHACPLGPARPHCGSHPVVSAISALTLLCPHLQRQLEDSAAKGDLGGVQNLLNRKARPLRASLRKPAQRGLQTPRPPCCRRTRRCLSIPLVTTKKNEGASRAPRPSAGPTAPAPPHCTWRPRRARTRSWQRCWCDSDFGSMHAGKPSPGAPAAAAAQPPPPPARRSAQNFGADVDVKDSQGWRALHLAALHGQAECVDQLMKAGASLEVRGDLGQTALIWAAMWGQADCVTLLCRGGAKTEVRSASAGSALRRAAGLF